MEPDCCHFQVHSTKATQCRAGSKRTNLSAFSNIQVGHCSCEVPKRKGRKELDEKDGDEAWEYFIHLLAGVRAAVFAWCGLNVRTVFLSEKHVSNQFGKLHLKEFGIPRPKSSTSCGQAWPMSSPWSQAARKALAKAASKAAGLGNVGELAIGARVCLVRSRVSPMWIK